MTDVVLKDTLNQTWKNDKSGFGFRMLQKMGWKEDKGLGKDEDGIAISLKVKKREDGLGLGMEESNGDKAGKGWNATATSFNAVLDALKSSYGTNEKDVKKKKKKKNLAIIPVGMKYKKLLAAKDISSKSESDLKSILGAAVSKTTTHVDAFAEYNKKRKSIKHKGGDEDDNDSNSEMKEKKKKNKKSKKSKKNEDDDQ
jgi:hypothetical protein